MHGIIETEAIAKLLNVVEGFFIVYLLGYSTFLFISMVVAVGEIFDDKKKKMLKNVVTHEYYFPVSIIVPAYNEEITIIDTIESLKKLDYKTYEIIVVSDGSTDETVKKVIEKYDLVELKRPICEKIKTKKVTKIYENSNNITLIEKENGGKADSINVGINVSKYGYFVCMDADSLLQNDALKKIASQVLESDNVIAVGSMVRISNDSKFKNGRLVEFNFPKKIIPASQVLEYERSFLATRIFLNKFNQNLIISGAFGLFKKECVMNVGGYETSSMGEDMELIVKLHSYYRANKLNYKIKYSYDAVCWTQAPENLKDLVKQRRRWHIGLYESLKLHKSMFTKMSYIYYLVYELLSPFIEIIGLIFIGISWFVGLLSVRYMILFFAVYAIFGATLTMISFLSRNFVSDVKISTKDMIKATLLSIPETLFLRFILAITRITSLFTKKKGWGKIKRVKNNYN